MSGEGLRRAWRKATLSEEERCHTGQWHNEEALHCQPSSLNFIPFVVVNDHSLRQRQMTRPHANMLLTLIVSTLSHTHIQRNTWNGEDSLQTTWRRLCVDNRPGQHLRMYSSHVTARTAPIQMVTMRLVLGVVQCVILPLQSLDRCPVGLTRNTF